MPLTLSHPAVLEADDRSALYFSFDGADELMFLCADTRRVAIMQRKISIVEHQVKLDWSS